MLTFSYDDYVQDFQDAGNAIWVTELSDGRSVYMDDYRPGVEPHSAWMRLRRYLKDNPLKIDTIYLRFRSNIIREVVPYRADGYFFSRKLLGEWGSPDPVKMLVLGYLQGDTVFTTDWTSPSLQNAGHSSRPVDLSSECLILNG